MGLVFCRYKCAADAKTGDKLFNATSLREASRSTTMNRYVIVFTVMTVLYLPPSLVAVLLPRCALSSYIENPTNMKFRPSSVPISSNQTTLPRQLPDSRYPRLSHPSALTFWASCSSGSPTGWISLASFGPKQKTGGHALSSETRTGAEVSSGKI